METARILIVEDQAIIALDLQTRLTSLGYQVAGTVASGDAALQQLQHTPPDLVLMDIVLKGPLDGIETAVQIRAQSQIPIVYVTAHSDEATLQRASATEPDGYILKPFEDAAIRSTIEIALYKHRMERQLRQSEARFRSLIEHTDDVILVVDAAGSVTYASPSAQRLVGDWPINRLDAVVAEFVAPDDIAAVYAELHQVQSRPNAQASIEECRVRLRDGDWHTFTAVATNLLHDPAVNGIVVNAHDITERQRAGERLDQLFVSTQRHARELAALNTAFHAMSSSLELQSVLKVVTSELQRLVGAESVSVLLRDGDELVFAAATGPGADELIGTRMPATAGIAGAVLQSQTPAISTHAQADQRFYTAIDKQTGLATQTILAVPLAHDGRAIGVMEAINKAPTSSLQVTEVESFGGHDLDLMVAIAGSAAIAIENARLYEAQREHNRRLQAAQPQLIQTEKMAALGRLAASLSHEINNPLQAVQGCLNLMDEAFKSAGPLGRDAQAELQQDLQIAISEFDRVANIVRRLRALYYAAPAQPATTDVPVQIELVLDLAAQALADRLITVERHYALDEVGDLRVAADPDRFRHVLLTLVLSAIDSMPEGGTLSLEAGRDSRAIPGVRIAVGDTGPQIPAEMLPRLFEPFQVVRAHDSSLGLSISYELIASLGGELTAENRPDAGMTITIWLPSGPEEDFDG